jgi:hypothetical protein
VAGDFLEQQQTARPQHASDLADRFCHPGTWWMIPKSTTVSIAPDACSIAHTSPTDNDTGRPCSRRRASSTIESSRSKAVTLSAPRRSRITSARQPPEPRGLPPVLMCGP